MASLYYRAMEWENECVRGSIWPGQLGMDPHELAGGLYNSGGSSLCRNAPEPSANEADLAGGLHGGSGEGIGLGGMPSGLRRHRAPNTSWLVSPVDASGLVRVKMPVFSPAQAV